MDLSIQSRLFGSGKRLTQITAVTVAAILAIGTSTPVFADQDLRNGKIRRVLLISFDGMHALDMANYIKAKPASTLALLAGGGVNFTNASTTKPSDSIPAMVGLVTGGTPAVAGMYYDDAWDRKLSPPGSNCATVGTAIDLKEGIDINPAALDGGGGIDPAKLPLDPAKGCTPVYPHNMLRVNTIFEVIRASGGYTAYTEKRPSDDFLNGPSGTGVMDLFVPEIVAYNGITDFGQVKVFDQLRVDSIINEIDGKDHSGTRSAPVPTIFGMNFQVINVAKKTSGVINNALGTFQGGYVDHFGTPAAAPLGNLQEGLDFADAQLGRIVAELKAKNLYEKHRDHRHCKARGNTARSAPPDCVDHSNSEPHQHCAGQPRAQSHGKVQRVHLAQGSESNDCRCE